ncbi:unnamed protein product [Vicia faba]|uniref:Uncharacterized protein n=1 Tax=Vicia faba TaxID=3906 RepID=A0AAV0YQS2_VICFA|nr:unnamed protein product [Vicia faba]
MSLIPTPVITRQVMLTIHLFLHEIFLLGAAGSLLGSTLIRTSLLSVSYGKVEKNQRLLAFYCGEKWLNIKPKVNDFSEDEVDTETESEHDGIALEDRKQTLTNYQFGPFAPAFVSKSKTFENTKVKQVHDWESLAIEHSPQQECVDAMLLGLPENAFICLKNFGHVDVK